MAQARQRDAWNHTAALLALLANVHRDPKKGRALKPGDFHPIQATQRPICPPFQGDICVLKRVFIDNIIPPSKGGVS